MMDERKMRVGSVFDDDLETSFDNADITASLMRIERQLVTLNITLAFGIGVLMFMAAKR